MPELWELVEAGEEAHVNEIFVPLPSVDVLLCSPRSTA